MTWKVLLFAILLMSVFSFGMAHAYNGQVFFMKSNSTAKLYTELVFPRVDDTNWIPYPSAFLYPEINDGNTAEVHSITIMAEPNPVTVNQHNINVTYTIITKNNTKGIFEIFTGSWGYSYLLVVGLNEFEVNPVIFHNFHPIDCVFCPAFRTEPPKEILLGYSGMTSVSLSGNSGTWWVFLNSLTTPQFRFATIMSVISTATAILLYQFKFRKRK